MVGQDTQNIKEREEEILCHAHALLQKRKTQVNSETDTETMKRRGNEVQIKFFDGVSGMEVHDKLPTTPTENTNQMTAVTIVTPRFSCPLQRPWEASQGHLPCDFCRLAILLGKACLTFLRSWARSGL